MNKRILPILLAILMCLIALHPLPASASGISVAADYNAGVITVTGSGFTGGVEYTVRVVDTVHSSVKAMKQAAADSNGNISIQFTTGALGTLSNYSVYVNNANGTLVGSTNDISASAPPTPTPPPISDIIWNSAPDYKAVKFLGTANTGIVTTEYDVIPMFNNIDGVIGYADTSTTINNVSDLGPIVWFSTDGTILAMDGQWPYTALNTVHYTAGNSYHIKMVADVSENTFDIWVTSPGGTPTMIADDYHFRYSAPPTDDLGKICLMSANGDAIFKVVNHVPQEIEKLPDLIAPSLGYYTTLEPVALTSVQGASIYYTTDNSIPSDKSTLYTGPLDITEPVTIKAIAYMNNTFSNVATFQVKSAEPFGLPSTGTYGEAQKVTLSSVDPDVQIYYTTNGDEPTSQSALYSKPLNIASSTIIKAIAVKNGLSSNVATLQYNITTVPSMFLKANGKSLRNNYGAGGVVPLRGTNAGGWLVQENWMSPTNAPDQKTMVDTFTIRFGTEKAAELIDAFEDSWWQEADFDNIKAMGMNVIRLPFTYLDLLDKDMNLKPDAFKRLDWFVEQSSKRGLYTILDMHGAPGSQNGLQHSGDASGAKLYNSEYYMSKTAYLWESIADRYKGNPYIAGYDLLNEPTGAVAEDQWDFFDRLYKAIRKIDPDHVIFMNAIWDPENMPDPSQYGWENISYEYHFYEWENTADYSYQTAFIRTKMEKIISANYDLPTLIGEFCLFENAQSWDYALHQFNQLGLSWTTWSYKSGYQPYWGIYNSTPSSTPNVNIYNDSFEQIMEKWSHVDTATKFTRNDELHNLFEKYAKEPIAEPTPTPTPTPAPTSEPTSTPAPTSTPTPTPTPAPVSTVTFKNTITLTMALAAEADPVTGAKSAKVDSTVMGTLMAKAKDAEASGAKAVIGIKVETAASDQSVKVGIRSDDIKQIANTTNADLKLETGIGSITFDSTALSAMSTNAATADITISMERVDRSALPQDVQEKVADRPVYDFSITSGGDSVSSFGSGSAKVSIPYTLKPGEKKNAIIVYYIDHEGKLQIVTGMYNPAAKSVDFITTHFSKYLIGYHEVKFSDVSDHAWYDEAVGFLAARGIVNGVGGGRFAPGKTITRADFLVMAMDAYGIVPDAGIADNFVDADNKYYTSYLATAKALDLVEGVGNNRFGPETFISRQDMIVVLNHLLGKINKLPTSESIKTIGEFSDAGSIAAYAEDAMKHFVEAGVIVGDGKSLAPGVNSTRAEASQLLYNLLSK